MIFLLICYFISLLIFAAFSASGIYHLWRFGYVGDLTKPVIFLYVAVSITTIILTLTIMSFRSWPSAL
ncbi:hypothetical protein COT12_00770 [Candidatus Berkelbacteria bacterium CG08_land_8_20_14_0_20_39_8]|uniref:Uncharacterized protein n=1 Tax=Candidatus Berkelbacteria bacterium CG08_land_8_20_14_0_20_39_8 TaxID=1974511 RepID=A0A2M6YCQ4_9BACT|nr:MAG: hypothetical protein COT12_00770 [Candidatus Berkelbacteria bacterium CG08_land_8_20_14_0_20_39_8]